MTKTLESFDKLLEFFDKFFGKYISGLSTGASWLCYYKALQDGEAGIVVPIDKLSILVTIAFSYIVFKERLSKKAMLGLVMIVFGTLVLLV